MPRSRGGRPAPRPMGRSPSPSSGSSTPSGSRGYSTSTAPRSAPQQTQQTAPAPSPGYAPAPSSGGGGMMGGLMGTMAQGMALGTGSAIAHRTIDSAWGAMSGGGGAAPEPAQVQAGAQQLQEARHPCADAAQQFADCMSRSSGDMGACEFFYNAMQQCKTQNP